ncbi:MAG: hypothetical protein KYX69_12675 [Sphingomonas sp.]|uniref:hypothetical protein n=1 Tax=Sphingomonas sp. TaxID=28214 RepID=UPI0026061E3D|nr:hypothetical protein [Sphingomonas sp.]MDK2768558.1 hypothetical protein [Sphingomonas sp.]
MSIGSQYPSDESVPTKAWEHVLLGATLVMAVLAIVGAVTTGQLLMIGVALPYIAVFLGALFAHRARRMKRSQAREEFLSSLKALDHG